MWGRVDDQQSKAALKRAFELGITFYDTADVYGFGHSEELIAEVLGAHRDEIVIATKGGVGFKHKQLRGNDSSPDHIRQAIDDSLRRLKTDVLDLYQIHWPDPRTPVEDTMNVVLEAQQAGKIRYIGVSNYDVELMKQAMNVIDLCTLQPPYSMIRRQVEDEILPFCLENNIGVLAYSPMCAGLLTGKFTPDWEFDEGDWRASNPEFRGGRYLRNLRVVDKLRVLADRLGRTVSQVAINWVLSNPAVTVALVGAKTPKQVEQNVGAVGWRLTKSDLDEIEDILQEPE